MQIVHVEENNKDFYDLCLSLQEFQHQMLPALAEGGYSLIDKLDDIKALVLYDGKIAIGSIGLKYINDETCEIVRVFVKNEYRGKGLAKLLFDKIENYARELGYKQAEMVTWAESTSALALYKKLGYVRSEEKISEWFKGLRYIELHKDL